MTKCDSCASYDVNEQRCSLGSLARLFSCEDVINRVVERTAIVVNDRKFPWNSKLNDITWGLINKKFECTQRSWLKWAKPYTSRVVRRKQKQELKKSGDNDECYKEFNDQFRQIAEMLEEIVYPEKEKESKKTETK